MPLKSKNTNTPFMQQHHPFKPLTWLSQPQSLCSTWMQQSARVWQLPGRFCQSLLVSAAEGSRVCPGAPNTLQKACCLALVSLPVGLWCKIKFVRLQISLPSDCDGSKWNGIVVSLGSESIIVFLPNCSGLQHSTQASDLLVCKLYCRTNTDVCSRAHH